MTRSRTTNLIALALLLGLGLCLAVASRARAAAPRDVGATSPGGVSVVGNQLELDAQPWTPRGVQIVGIVAPNSMLSGQYVAANQHFGQGELAAIAQTANADTVRFQVSETGLDPQSANFSASYLQEVEGAVASARALGLEVIISVQAETPSGAQSRCLMPDAGTQRVWQELAPLYASDHGVMFELYNEPGLNPTEANWLTWAYGGPTTASDKSTCQAVGMQALIDTIRSAGATNVIIVPGLKFEQSFKGVMRNTQKQPALTDPAFPLDPQLAYGVHYPFLGAPTSQWTHRFGNLAQTAPVVVTEWWAGGISENCSDAQPTNVATLLGYLRKADVGVVGFAFDIPGTIVADWDYTPTNYTNFNCANPANGAGEELFADFAQEAAANAVTAPARRARIRHRRAVTKQTSARGR